MNLTAIIPLLKLLQESGAVSPKRPAPEIPTNVRTKPVCGPGRYAYKDPLSGLWSCLLIPKGR
jgi:hypothetical protein